MSTMYLRFFFFLVTFNPFYIHDLKYAGIEIGKKVNI